MSRVLASQPLKREHDGVDHMCEQGVVAATYQLLDPEPIPLYEFPFGRAVQDELDFGLEGDLGRAWGYHFGNSFRRDNPHFHRLTAAGAIFSAPQGDLLDRFRWLGEEGPWGIPGWAMPEPMVRTIMAHTRGFGGREVLEIGRAYDRLLRPLGVTIEGPSLHHLYCIRVPRRDSLMAALALRGIGTKVHWDTPLNRLNGPWVSAGSFEGAERWCSSVVSLPYYPGLTDGEIDRIGQAVAEHVSSLRGDAREPAVRPVRSTG